MIECNNVDMVIMFLAGLGAGVAFMGMIWPSNYPNQILIQKLQAAKTKLEALDDE